MRLAEGIVIDDEKTFGDLKFSTMRRVNYVEDEDGMQTDQVKGRTYDLRSKEQGMMVQVTLPPNVPEKKIGYGIEVKLVNPVVGTVANATYNGNADVSWYMTADDIVERRGKSGGGSHSSSKQGESVGKDVNKDSVA